MIEIPSCQTMNVYLLLNASLVLLLSTTYSGAHSASSSSALASSIKFKLPKLEKDKGVSGRRKNFGVETESDGDDEGSE